MATLTALARHDVVVTKTWNILFETVRLAQKRRFATTPLPKHCDVGIHSRCWECNINRNHPKQNWKTRKNTCSLYVFAKTRQTSSADLNPGWAPASDTTGSRCNRAASQQNKHHSDTFSAALQAGVIWPELVLQSRSLELPKTQIVDHCSKCVRYFLCGTTRRSVLDQYFFYRVAVFVTEVCTHAVPGKEGSTRFEHELKPIWLKAFLFKASVAYSCFADCSFVCLQFLLRLCQPNHPRVAKDDRTWKFLQVGCRCSEATSKVAAVAFSQGERSHRRAAGSSGAYFDWKILKSCATYESRCAQLKSKIAELQTFLDELRWRDFTSTRRLLLRSTSEILKMVLMTFARHLESCVVIVEEIVEITLAEIGKYTSWIDAKTATLLRRAMTELQTSLDELAISSRTRGRYWESWVSL